MSEIDKADVLALQKHYEDKGFFIAQASYQVKPQENGAVNVIFKVKEWDKVMVKKITFLGNKAINDQELKGFMQTQEETLFSGMSGSVRQRRVMRQPPLASSRSHSAPSVPTPMLSVPGR